MRVTHPTARLGHACDKTCANGRTQSAEHIAAVVAGFDLSPFRQGDSRALIARCPLRHLQEVTGLLTSEFARAAWPASLQVRGKALNCTHEHN